MSVRRSLLAILDQGACYGYQLRAEFDRRTGSTWPLNVGQIYNTLDRLERDGLVCKGEVGDQGQVYYAITPAGSAEVSSWLATPVERAHGTRDELAIKLAVAATLPGVDVGRVIDAQRAASTARRDELDRAADALGDPDDPEGVAAALVLDAMRFAAEAEVRWIEHAERRLAKHPSHSIPLELTTERPRRGRPAGGPAS
jgi:DNA-binding PadR family transcriptional regulator